MKKIKYVLVSLIAVLCTVNVNAQSLRIYQNDGTIITVPHAKLDSIVAVNEDHCKYEFVDLGLPSGVKWASCNVGASSPEEYGDYFAWGEIIPKVSYYEANSLTYDKHMGDISGSSYYDAATVNWGSPARMPTRDEFEELVKSCTWQFTTYNTVEGMLVTGPNGNSIFLPFAGSRVRHYLRSAGECGDYWSSTPYESYDYDAYSLSLDALGCYWGGWEYLSSRCDGQSVRPVSN